MYRESYFYLFIGKCSLRFLQTEVCTKCGSMNSIYKQISPVQPLEFTDTSVVSYCRFCETSEFVKTVSVPSVLKLLVAEFACMNIKTVFKVK